MSARDDAVIHTSCASRAEDVPVEPGQTPANSFVTFRVVDVVAAETTLLRLGTVGSYLLGWNEHNQM